MQRFFSQIQRRVQWSARRSGRFAIGAALLIVGFGFLTAAGWAYLAAEFSPVLASLACGGLYLVLAVVFFMMASSEHRPEVPTIEDALKEEFRDRRRAAPDQASAQGERPPLLEAFLTGFEAYIRLQKKRD
ncbi:MAG: phage holin family protein [Roseinatronobacter sp.]